MTSGDKSGAEKEEFGKQARLWLGASLIVVAIGFGFFGYGIHVAENPKERFFAAMAAAIVSAAVSVFFALHSHRVRKEAVEVCITRPRSEQRLKEALDLTEEIEDADEVKIRMRAVFALQLGGRRISDGLMRDVMGVPRDPAEDDGPEQGG